MRSALPAGREMGVGLEALLESIVGAVAVGGIAIAWVVYLRFPRVAAALPRGPVTRQLGRFWSAGWGFDVLYGWLIERPYRWFARVDQRDALDQPFRGVALGARGLGRLLTRSETGRLRWYAMSIVAGAVIVIAIVLFA
jgi:NADH-quinone oxidoreductase subunit L